MTAEPIRRQVRALYHRRGKTPRSVAQQLRLPLDEVMKLVSSPPLPTCRRPGCEREVRRPEASYCSKSCQWSAMTEAERPVGCGCTDIKLCPRHGAKLKGMWRDDQKNSGKTGRGAVNHDRRTT